MIPFFSAILLGFLMILDPCTLFTSIAAIGYIDREMQNRRRVLITGLMFVAGKLATYVLLSIPFIMGAQTTRIQHLLTHWGEPLLAAFMVVCGLLLLFSGHHHHDHDHGVSKWLQTVDERSSWLWAFMLGIFFAIAFCPHRLIYFFAMIEMAMTLPSTQSYIMPVLFGLGTGLPVMLLAWIISYTSLSTNQLTDYLRRFERWFRYACAIIFLAYGTYMGVHCFSHHHGHHTCECEQCEVHE